MLDSGITDSLISLLLPADDFYYTSHSTKYAKFIKYHTARILVYLGKFQCIGGRVDLFEQSGILGAVLKILAFSEGAII